MDLSAAFERVDALARQKMAAGRFPGLAVGITDRAGLVWSGCYGYADLAARTPVTPETLFEIGSIGKSFTSLALLQLQEAGQLDVLDPVTRYLPWFQIQTRHAPIRLHDLLSHTAGIVRGSDFSPESFAEVWALRDTETGSAPGEHFLYSNTGYKALGLVLEAVTGQSYGENIRRRILEPLGMASTDAVITHDSRRRMAVGYQPFYDDRPSHPSHGWAPATWFETATGDGCIASNLVDMARYLRLYLAGGEGPAGRVVSAETFARMTEGVLEREPGLKYGYGIARIEKDGHTSLAHGGGMVGYLSNIRVDLGDGFGVVLLVNGPEIPLDLSEAAFGWLSAALRGEELAPVPAEQDPFVVADAADYAGLYRSSSRVLRLQAVGGGLVLSIGDEQVPLERREGGYFYAFHPAFERHLLHFERAEGQVVALDAGPDSFDRDGVPALPRPALPAEWEAYTGRYRSYNPWISNFRVVARRGGLVLVHPRHGEDPLVPVSEGLFRIGAEPWIPERIRFHTVIDGKAQIASLTGSDFYWAGEAGMGN